MKFTTFLKLMLSITSLALIYIHMQMQIIDLAYQAKAKENKIRKLIEHNGNITYTILTLKSSNSLGVKMLSDNSNMEFMDPNNIIKISTAQIPEKRSSKNVQLSLQKSQSLLNLFALGTQAEAKDR